MLFGAVVAVLCFTGYKGGYNSFTLSFGLILNLILVKIATYKEYFRPNCISSS